MKRGVLEPAAMLFETPKLRLASWARDKSGEAPSPNIGNIPNTGGQPLAAGWRAHFLALLLKRNSARV
jgi:hypothetical protein